jgi:hypothetical protein
MTAFDPESWRPLGLQQANRQPQPKKVFSFGPPPPISLPLDPPNAFEHRRVFNCFGTEPSVADEKLRAMASSL